MIPLDRGDFARSGAGEKRQSSPAAANGPMPRLSACVMASAAAPISASDRNLSRLFSRYGLMPAAGLPESNPCWTAKPKSPRTMAIA